jgi:hypothetical protein
VLGKQVLLVRSTHHTSLLPCCHHLLVGEVVLVLMTSPSLLRVLLHHAQREMAGEARTLPGAAALAGHLLLLAPYVSCKTAQQRAIRRCTPSEDSHCHCWPCCADT